MPIDLLQIKLRGVSNKDIEIFTTYRLAYLTELQGERDEQYKQKVKQELNQFFTESLREDRAFAFMAEYDGETIGFGAMIIKKIPGDFNKSSYLEGDILNMYTVPSARSQGVSSLILERLIKEAKRRGISKISLHTTKAGEKLYRKYGFSEPIYPVLELIP